MSEGLKRHAELVSASLLTTRESDFHRNDIFFFKFLAQRNQPIKRLRFKNFRGFSAFRG